MSTFVVFIVCTSLSPYSNYIFFLYHVCQLPTGYIIYDSILYVLYAIISIVMPGGLFVCSSFFKRMWPFRCVPRWNASHIHIQLRSTCLGILYLFLICQPQLPPQVCRWSHIVAWSKCLFGLHSA